MGEQDLPAFHSKACEGFDFSENWYNTYGNHLITALINQFANNTVKKVRYFQLKCLQTLISERPDAVKQYAEVFQYDILLRYIKLQPED